MDDWRIKAQIHRISAFICGHTHYWQVANDGRNVFLAMRSIGDPEGGAAGYCIGYACGEDLAFVYRTIEDMGPIVLITHPRETLLATGGSHVVSGPDEIRARTWSDEAIDDVRGRIDDGSWFDLTTTGSGVWSIPLAGGELDKGGHSLEVEAKSKSGAIGRQRIGFLVDPTGRYTAVPAARPQVVETAFC